MLVFGGMRSWHFEDVAFRFSSQLLKFLRRAPVALVIGCCRNSNVIHIAYARMQGLSHTLGTRGVL